MLKKFLAFPLLGLLLFTGAAFAQEGDLPDPGITPDSPFYFLDTFGESLQLFFAFSPSAKAETAARIAGEKAAEARAMAEAGKPDAAARAADRYGAMISIATANLAAAVQAGEIDQALAELVARATSIHLDVLTDVLERVSEEAQSAIESAIDEGERGVESALDALENKEELKEEVQNRLNESRNRREAPVETLEGAPEEIPGGVPEGIPGETRP